MFWIQAPGGNLVPVWIRGVSLPALPWRLCLKAVPLWFPVRWQKACHARGRDGNAAEGGV